MPYQFLRFTNDPEELLREGRLSLANNRITIYFASVDEIPSEEIMLGGFDEINENDKKTVQGQHHGQFYLYRQLDDTTFVITDDEEDVYVEPVEPEVPEEGELIEEEEYVPTVEEVAREKVAYCSTICSSLITAGVDVLIGEEVEHFSYSSEDQINIKELFDLAISSGSALYYHSDGNSCKLYQAADIIKIYALNAMNKMHHTTYYNQLKLYINSLTSAEDIQTVWYGAEQLQGEYLETYNAAMAQARSAMSAILQTDITEMEAELTEYIERTIGSMYAKPDDAEESSESEEAEESSETTEESSETTEE